MIPQKNLFSPIALIVEAAPRTQDSWSATYTSMLNKSKWTWLPTKNIQSTFGVSSWKPERMEYFMINPFYEPNPKSRLHEFTVQVSRVISFVR